MLSHYNPITLEIILREEQPGPPFPPITERAAWERIRAKLEPEELRALLARAASAAREPIPPLPASLWLECQRTGERGGYETPCYRRRTLMRDLLIGECLENAGRWVDPLVDVIWAICEESSWVFPAHHPDLADVDNPYIDLGVAMTAFELAEAAALAGPILPRAVTRRIRYEVDRRALAPYLARHDFWWLYSHRDRPVNNWTAVCNAGVMAAALYLEDDPARLADILAKGLRSLDDYLLTFDEDGGSSEGPGYWTYGFGYYTLIAQLVEQRTNAQVRLLDGDLLRKIAMFPARTILSQGMYVNFSDAPRQATFISAMLTYLARRLEIPELLQLAREQPGGLEHDLNWLVRSLVWDLPTPNGSRMIPARHDWYNGMMWMFSRYDPTQPDALVLAAKGGHNDEMHNHNDVGNFVVHYCQESIIADVGCGRYTLQYFSQDRYEHFAASSLGHSVPVVNGQIQQAGREHAARLIEHSHSTEQDCLHLEIKDAYPPEAGLQSLQRRLVFHREAPAGWVEVEDIFIFRDGPGMIESALTTFGQVELGENAAILHGLRGRLRVGYDPEIVGARVELFQDVDLADGRMDVRRVVFALLEPRQEGRIRLEIVPL